LQHYKRRDEVGKKLELNQQELKKKGSPKNEKTKEKL
jgi:hypothetical protein